MQSSYARIIVDLYCLTHQRLLTLAEKATETQLYWRPTAQSHSIHSGLDMSTPEPANSALNSLVSASNDLGFRLLTQLATKEEGKNILLSSFSAAIALAMTYNGAEGETKQALANLLGVDGLDLEEVNQVNAVLMTMADGLGADVQLAIANSIWLRSGISASPDFIGRMADFYRGEVASLNFATMAAVNTINDWASRETQGKIGELVTLDLIRDAILILINAIYFKGIWTQPFDAEKTTERPFTRLDGSQKLHPMMSQSGRYDYFENELFQAVSLPYGDGRVSMLLFLPRPALSLNDLLRSLTPETWPQWIARFRDMKGSVVLPRFKVEYGVDLFPHLVELGGQALAAVDFLGMGAGPLMISSVIHKSFIEVNEEGTEAAAATAVIMMRSPQPSFQMVLDRPFLCAIRDNETGMLLFTGVVVEPTIDDGRRTTDDGRRTTDDGRPTTDDRRPTTDD
jgi:serine protease inhibitor